jgi:hypothetical protein
MSPQPSIVLKPSSSEEKDMTTKASTTRRLTRYLAGPALALGVALGSASVATALPEWDIGAYDQCTKNIPEDVLLDDRSNDAFHECCWKSGGVWNSTINKCQAPPAGQSGRNPLTGAPTHVMQPAPLPAPPGDIGPVTGGVG